MKVNPYLLFNGNCRQAFERYAEILGGRIEAMQTHGESPMRDQVLPEWQDAIIHACLIAGDVTLMASDAPPEHHEPAQGLYVALQVEELAGARRIFDALAEGGSVRMPFEKTFWSPGFGMFVDRFGTPWMVNACEAA